MAVYKRTIFVVDPKFQYKFSFVICSLVFLSSLMYPLTIYDLFDKIIALQPRNAIDIAGNRNFLLSILCLAQVSFLGVIFVISIFLSHKIAGPMFKLKKYLSDIRNGAPVTKLFFRNGDAFEEVADEVTETLEYLTKSREDDFKYLEEVSSYINNLSLVLPEDKKPVLQEILSKLAEIQTRNR